MTTEYLIISLVFGDSDLHVFKTKMYLEIRPKDLVFLSPMAFRPHTVSETQKRRSLLQRMTVVHGFFLLMLLVIVARLIDLQIINGQIYHEKAQSQHFRGIRLPAKRGEILGLSSKTNETNIFATNTTLDLVYVDPLVVDDPTLIAETLTDIL